MRIGEKLLACTTALLFLGPALAGISGRSWPSVPVFIALIALWLVVMRPAQWPRDFSLWTRQTALSALAQLAVNALIVVVLFAIGRALSGMAGFLPNIPPIFPVALSFLAIPLSRLAVDPAKMAARDGFVDAALKQISDPSAGAPSAPTGDEMVAVLLSLPADSDPMLMADAVDAAMKGRNAGDRLAELEAFLCRSDASSRALCEAVILWATDPARHEAEGFHRAQDVAFQIAGTDPLLLHLFAHRGLALLSQRPGLWTAFPDAEEVSMAADPAQPENLQKALVYLSDALEAAAAAHSAEGAA